MSKIKVLVVPSDKTGVSYFRSTKPHLHLEEMYPDEFHVDIDYEPQLNNDEWLKQYQIIHYHRQLGPFEEMEELNARLKALGIVSIMDLDDYWSPGPHHPAYLTIKSYEIDKKIARNLKMAQYITTTTPIFAEEIKKLNKNVSILPNAIDPNEKQFQLKPTSSNRIRIGWLGGSTHLRDLELLSDIVKRLRGSGLLDKIQFVICGFDTKGVITTIDPKTKKEVSRRESTAMESVWIEYEKIFTDNYSTISPEYKAHLMSFTKNEFVGVENEPYRRVWTKDINSYATNYNLFDISLAPLESNIFNKVKSQLKVIESGFFKKPIIAQNFGPYTIDLKNVFQKGGTLDENGNSFMVDHVKNHKDWIKYITLFVQNPELIEKIGNNLYNTVSNKYSMDKVTEDRRNLYLELVNR